MLLSIKIFQILKNNLRKKNNLNNVHCILYDRTLVWLILGLSSIGLVIVASASMPLGQFLYNDPFFFTKREICYFFIVFILSFIFLRIPMVFWKENSDYLILISIFLLCLVLVAGESVNGSSRWIKIGLIHIQPSEICKIASLCYISSYLSQRVQEVQSNLWGFFQPISVITIQSILLLAEPDLGTVIVLFSTSLAILFLSGARIKHCLVTISICIIILIFLIIIEPYRMKRILSFWNPWQDPFGRSYQLIQSLIAFGRGQLFGQGLGNSIQKLSYLPESHSDFIFSIIGEELGYLGAVLILLMIFFLSFRAMHIGKKALENKNIFSGFLACSIGIWLSVQTFINVGTVTGLLPTKGLTLPFISYGGSSLIIVFIAMFFLLRIDFENRLNKVQKIQIGIQMNIKKIIIIAGGSGGHVFPALSIAYDLIAEGWHVRWIGTKNNIESIIIPKNNIPIDFIDIRGLRNANFRTFISSPIYILRAYYQIKKIMINWSPNIVLGMGGYVSGPGGIAAWRSNIPFILHEQNKIAGITNKLLSQISTYNMQAFSGALKNAKVVGNPVRKNIINVPSPRHRFKNREGPLRLLIMGGSKGAKIFNDHIPEISLILKNKIIIWHQVGDHPLKPIQERYYQKELHLHKITHFINNISSAYEWADIAICRSGALTVSEISIVGLAAIFVPYPHQDQQQYLNSLELYNIGAAKIIDQNQFNIKILIKTLNSLNRKKMYIMAKKAYSLGIRNSTEKIIKIIKNITHDVSNEKQ